MKRTLTCEQWYEDTPVRAISVIHDLVCNEMNYGVSPTFLCKIGGYKHTHCGILPWMCLRVLRKPASWQHTDYKPVYYQPAGRPAGTFTPFPLPWPQGDCVWSAKLPLYVYVSGGHIYLHVSNNRRLWDWQHCALWSSVITQADNPLLYSSMNKDGVISYFCIEQTAV